MLDTARRIRKLDPGVSISLISHDLRDSLEGYEIPLFRFYAGTVPMPVLQQDLEELMQKNRKSRMHPSCSATGRVSTAFF